jgi:uncharacterized membrane protein YfcA
VLADVAPLVLRALLGFAIAVVCTPAGVSGAFLLLPIQVQFLGAPSPAVSATNLLFNVVASPAGAVAYLRRRAVDAGLLRPLLAGTLPGVVTGVALRTTWLADAEQFAWPAAVVLVGLGGRLVVEALRSTAASAARPDLPATARLVAIGGAAGLVGGVYGIGGAAIAVPWLVGAERVPVARVAGASLVLTFVSSCVGLTAFVAGAALDLGAAAAPHWDEGIALGIGGVAGAVVGANIQRFVPVRALRLVIGAAALAAGIRMVA